MAGPQATVMQNGKIGDRYPVPDKNRPVSTVYFNEVKEYMKLKYSRQLTKWVVFFETEKAFYKRLRDEMDKYTFNFPDNQCRWFFAMLEERYHEQEAELSAKVRTEIQQSQTDSKQETKSEESQA